MQDKLLIIDYGVGNIWSIKSALDYLNYEYEICNNPDQLSQSGKIILPGVGSFRKAMVSLKSNGMDLAIKDAVLSKGTKILGICLGMQLLAKHSIEDGHTEGLGLIPTEVKRFETTIHNKLKVPHMGFNKVFFQNNCKLFNGIKNSSYFYFVHSYYLLPKNEMINYSICNYDKNFLATYEKDNIFGAQFHPEKSQTNGLLLLNNFIKN